MKAHTCLTLKICPYEINFQFPNFKTYQYFSLDAYIFCYWVLVWGSTVIFKKVFSEDLCLSQDLANEWDPDGGHSMCKGIKRT